MRWLCGELEMGLVEGEVAGGELGMGLVEGEAAVWGTGNGTGGR